jgi:nucleotide-binding universal stress UspA family protein
MSWRKILVPVEGKVDASGPVAHALELARAIGAHVELFHPGLDPLEALSYLGENMAGVMVESVIAAAEAESKGRIAKARADVAALLAARQAPLGATPAPGFSASFSTEAGRVPDLMLRKGRAADLIVAARPADDGPPPVILEIALMASGRPVLVVPPGPGPAPGAGTPRRIGIAWNGSLEATRALAEAMPLLARAAEVQVLAIGAIESGPSVDETVELLRWHDVPARGETLAAAGPGLLDAVTARGLELLVMGAYTHSRVRQLVLGGVTRDVLTRSTIPVLMAH